MEKKNWVKYSLVIGLSLTLVIPALIRADENEDATDLEDVDTASVQQKIHKGLFGKAYFQFGQNVKKKQLEHNASYCYVGATNIFTRILSSPKAMLNRSERTLVVKKVETERVTHGTLKGDRKTLKSQYRHLIKVSDPQGMISKIVCFRRDGSDSILTAGEIQGILGNDFIVLNESVPVAGIQQDRPLPALPEKGKPGGVAPAKPIEAPVQLPETPSPDQMGQGGNVAPVAQPAPAAPAQLPEQPTLGQRAQ